jgi:PAS domain S-box-containing protein
MIDRTSEVHELHRPEYRLGLRAQAAELLIQATDPAQAGRALFDLIAAKLKLNVFLLYVIGDDGGLELIAHGGLSENELAIAAAPALPGCDSGGSVLAPLAGQITGVQEREDDGATVLKSIGVKAWYGQQLMAGERLLGMLGFGRRWADRFHDQDLAFLQSVAHYFALAMGRLRGEVALRDSEERLRLGMMVAGFRTYDHNLLIGQLFLSPEVLAVMGIPPDQPPTVEQMEETLHPDDRERVVAARRAGIDPEGTGEFDQEFRVIRPDGAVRWMHVRAKTFFAGEAGARRAVRVIGAQQDITESTLAEQRLRDSEERLRLAVEAAGFGIFEYDVERDESIWSPELRALYGFGSDEAIDLEQASKRVHPDDRQRYLAPVSAAREGGSFEDLSHEFRIVRPDGEMRWLATKARLLFPPGGSKKPPSRIIGIVQDITERTLYEERLRDSEQKLRRSEQRLQRAQEMGDVASFEWDPRTDDTWVSESYRRIFGLPPAAPVNSKVWRTLVHPDDSEQAVGHMFKASETGEAQTFEYRIIRPSDHQERWIWTVCGASQDSSDLVTRLVGIALDVTEHKRNEERERLLSREVDHRAKNLLSVVQAMISLTHADSVPEFASQIQGRIQALGRVHGLLAASRWEGAELSMLIEDELAPFAGGGNRVQLSGPPIALRPAAAQSMALVIHELTTNAAKYGALSSRDGRLEVTWEGRQAIAGSMVLRWRESGGPIVVPPQHSGFGLSHIRGSVEHQLGGTLNLRWPTEGFQCELVLPSRQLVPN